MQTVQVIVGENTEVRVGLLPLIDLNPDLVFVFGPSTSLNQLAPHLVRLVPDASCFGCSTAFAVAASGVESGQCIVTGVRFDSSTIIQASTSVTGKGDSFDAGIFLGESLPKEGLRAVLVLCQGVGVSGSAVVRGLNRTLGNGVPIVGGLASRIEGYRQTSVLDRSGCGSERIAALGLYGNTLRFGFGVEGGWSPFGPARKVTACAGNVLYELDGEPALDVYRRYLGDYARDLPVVGRFFPFAVLDSNHDEIGLIRSMLGIDEKTGGLRFGDEIAPDAYLRMMHANTDKLVGGAEAAAEAALDMMGGALSQHGLAFVVSCVGRELVMGERVEEEIEAVADVVGQGVVMAGFYSFGEIAPGARNAEAKLHNQTVMIACFDEAAGEHA